MFREDCPCKRVKCLRHGDCDACREHHKNDKKNDPACDRIARKEERKKKHEK